MIQSVLPILDHGVLALGTDVQVELRAAFMLEHCDPRSDPRTREGWFKQSGGLGGFNIGSRVPASDPALLGDQSLNLNRARHRGNPLGRRPEPEILANS